MRGRREKNGSVLHKAATAALFRPTQKAVERIVTVKGLKAVGRGCLDYIGRNHLKRDSLRSATDSGPLTDSQFNSSIPGGESVFVETVKANMLNHFRLRRWHVNDIDCSCTL